MFPITRRFAFIKIELWRIEELCGPRCWRSETSDDRQSGRKFGPLVNIPVSCFCHLHPLMAKFIDLPTELVIPILQDACTSIVGYLEPAVTC
jgi:hypothetical protein